MSKTNHYKDKYCIAMGRSLAEDMYEMARTYAFMNNPQLARDVAGIVAKHALQYSQEQYEMATKS